MKPFQTGWSLVRLKAELQLCTYALRINCWPCGSLLCSCTVCMSLVDTNSRESCLTLEINEFRYRGLWGLVVIRLLWPSGRALAAQARGVMGLTPGGCRPFHFPLYKGIITLIYFWVCRCSGHLPLMCLLTCTCEVLTLPYFSDRVEDELHHVQLFCPTTITVGSGYQVHIVI